MRRTAVIVLSAATIVAALGVSGCSGRDSSSRPPSPVPPPPAVASAPADPRPLPPPEALTDVMYRLADPAVPGADKLPLVQNGAPPDAGTLDRFAVALRDAGFTPVTFTATDIRPSTTPDDVLATIAVTKPDGGSAPADPGQFSFPMEFHPVGGGWQLTRETAEELLAFGNAHADSTATAPSPPPTPTP